MQLVIGKSKWEMWDDPLETFLQRTQADGFDATEIHLPSLKEEPVQVADLHAQYSLRLIGQIFTEGTEYEDHLRSLEEQFERAEACGAVFVNSHAGRDRFAFDENVRIFERALALSEATGIPFNAETHRGRPTYSAIETRRYLDALPALYLTADFSHWMVVHESDLSDQRETLDLAIRRSRYIHARVGYEEGPQVPDPRAPEWQGHVEHHFHIWQQIFDRHLEDGADVFYITPEFGPPAYMHTIPFTNEPTADVWQTNVYMKELIQARFA